MSNQTLHPLRRGVAVAVTAAAFLAFGVAPAIQAQTNGMERRGERRDDRQGDRENRQDSRDECREQEGAGKDKRDCKQEGREENRGNAEPAPAPDA